MASAAPPAAAASTTITWTQRPGCGRDIDVGAELEVFPQLGGWLPVVAVVGCNPVRGGFAIYEMITSGAPLPKVGGEGGWARVPGGAVSIGAIVGSATDQGLWVTNNTGQIWTNEVLGPWTTGPGCGHEIDVGADFFSVWVIGCNRVPGGYGIYRGNSTGTGWRQEPGGGAVSISVDPSGNAWVTQDAGQIYRWNGRGWVRVPGCAHDVDVGADGSVWAIGCNPVPGGFGIYRRNSTDTGWDPQPGGAVRIGVDPGIGGAQTETPGCCNAWVINNVGHIYSS
jgi:hypothetical protein